MKRRNFAVGALGLLLLLVFLILVNGLSLTPLKAAMKNASYNEESTCIGESALGDYILVFFEEQDVIRTIPVKKSLVGLWRAMRDTFHAEKYGDKIETLCQGFVRDRREFITFVSFRSQDPAVHHITAVKPGEILGAVQGQTLPDAQPGQTRPVPVDGIVIFPLGNVISPVLATAYDKGGQILYKYQPGAMDHDYRWHACDG
ncbi:MAG: hypothetical protein GXX99_06620 [Clostridiales bacterium]|nr:hypothetical protein [Clostridiales bacterium]